MRKSDSKTKQPIIVLDKEPGQVSKFTKQESKSPDEARVQVKKKLDKIQSSRRGTVKLPYLKIIRNDKLQQHFKWLAGSDRLTKQRLSEVMAKRYPAGEGNQMSLSDSMTKQLWEFMNQLGSDLKYD
jgi:hypothetical protein